MEDWHELGADRDVGASLAVQLTKELSVGHELFGAKVSVVARRVSNDDILVTVDGSDGCVMVHLTWSTGPQSPPWPRSRWFDSMEAAKAGSIDS